MTKKRRRRLRNPLRTLEKKGVIRKGMSRDPMFIVLSALLIFITCGILLNGCSSAFSGTKKIMLDAAYGGENIGYAGVIKESEACEKIVDELEKLLQEDSRFKVVRTHDAGEAMNTKDRIKQIDKADPDLVLSIHASGSPNAAKSGMEVYAEIPSSKNHNASVKAASAIAEAFTSDAWKPEAQYFYFERSVASADTYTLKRVDLSDETDYDLATWDMMEKTSVPVVVVNSFCVSNSKDVTMWGNEAGYKKAAELYYKALKNTYGFSD